MSDSEKRAPWSECWNALIDAINLGPPDGAMWEGMIERAETNAALLPPGDYPRVADVALLLLDLADHVRRNTPSNAAAASRLADLLAHTGNGLAVTAVSLSGASAAIEIMTGLPTEAEQEHNQPPARRGRSH